MYSLRQDARSVPSPLSSTALFALQTESRCLLYLCLSLSLAATLAEFGLGAYAGSDFYDISLVVGFPDPFPLFETPTNV